MKLTHEKSIFNAALIALIWFGIGQTGFARTIHVSPSGDDGGPGTENSPLGSIQAGIDLATAGDTVLIAPGVYRETLRSRAAGAATAPITLLGEAMDEVIVTADNANLLLAAHPHMHVKQLVFDGQFAKHDLVRVKPAADGFVFERNVVVNGAKDGIDLGDAATRVPEDFDYLEGVKIINCRFSNFLARDLFGNRVDAHGIVAGGVRDLTIVHTSVSTVSGDALQLANGNWDNVNVENVRFENAPIDQALAEASGFQAGVNPGENAIDTKQDVSLPVRSRLFVRQSSFSGWKGDLISNSAALNLKEKVSVHIDGCEFRDNEIAMRLRGGGVSDGGAHVNATNNVIYANEKALRVEDDLREFRLVHNTFGGPGVVEFVAGGAAGDFFAANNLVLAATLPSPFPASLNRVVDDSSFIDVGLGNYQLAPKSPAIDNAVSLNEVSVDALGVPRPQGEGYDFGAYEYRSSPTALPMPRPVQVFGVAAVVVPALWILGLGKSAR